MNQSPLRLDTVEDIKIKKASSSYTFFKRSIDICAGLIGFLLFVGSFIFLSIFYLFGENKGPILFKQLRMGKDGKSFYIYKYRTMVVNAEEKLKSNRRLYNKYVANNYKLEQDEDPRITKFGAFLRKSSIDELPQFINVLKGEMSLVGPRPVIEEELDEYGFKKALLLSVKPGITGYWAASGRSSIDYPERVDLELHYVYNQSIIFDLKIIFLTVISVVLRRGAY